MRYPFPDFFVDWATWARELVLQLELPDLSRQAQDYQRFSQNFSVSTDTVLNYGYGVILVDTSAANVTLTMPVSKDDGWECEIVKTEAANRVIILPSGTDTLVGEASVEVYDQWTALRFRAVSGGFVLV